MAAGLLTAILPAAIQGITGLFGSIFNTSSQEHTNDKNLAWQTAQNDMNRQFNASEAEKQRQWQTGEWLNQFNMQREEWYRQQQAQFDLQKRMFDYQAAYNDPSAQLKRFQGAGLNSAALLGGQGSSGLVAASTANFGSAPSPSVPTGGAVTGSSASATPVGSPNLQAPQFDLGGLGNFLSQSAKAWSENKSLGPTIEGLYADIAKKRAETANVKVLTALNEVDLYVRQNTKDVKVRQEVLNLALTIADIDLKKAQGRNYDADTVFKQAEELLSESRKKLSDEQYVQLEFVTAHMLETWTNEQNALKAKAAQDYASAGYQMAQTDTENVLRPHKETYQKLMNEFQTYDNQIKGNAAAIDDATFVDRYKATAIALVNQMIQDGLVTKQMEEALRAAIKNNDFFLLRTLLGSVNVGANATYTNKK